MKFIYRNMCDNVLKILFRVSGGKSNNRELGMGHIYRCLNLASNFKKGNVFFAIEDFGGVKEVIIKRNFQKIFYLKKNTNLKNDLYDMINIIKKNNIDVIVVDIYKIQQSYLNVLRKYAKLVVISDLEKINFSADLVVNGFVGFKNSIKQNKFNSKCLLGPKYQILDRRFEKIKVKNLNKQKILITFGGYDENNITEKLYEILQNFTNNVDIKIILGPATKKTKKIKQFEKEHKKNIKIITKTNNMPKEISQASFGICAGGLTTYEFAAANIPMAIICQYKHQLKTANEWEKQQMAINLGLNKKNIDIKIIKLLEKIYSKKIKKTKKKIIDGYGSKRVSKEILQLIK